MDGLEPFSGFDPVTLEYNWMESDLLRNILIDPLTNIDLSTSHLVDNNIYVEARIDLIDTTIRDENLTMQIAVVENESAFYESVLKKMLPDAGGTSLIDLWQGNNSVTVYQSWAFNPADFVSVDSLILVAFVQNEDTKEIYQAAYVPFMELTGTGIFDHPGNVKALNYVVYPNPASGEVNLKFGQVLNETSQMQVFNELGALMEIQTLKKGNDLFTFNVSGYKQGVYLIKVTNAGNNAVGWKRLVVIR
jgi:hypothetical protein